jgi:hypothetical protein
VGTSFEKAPRQCERSLNILKDLSGRSWGGDRTAMLRLFRSRVPWKKIMATSCMAPPRSPNCLSSSLPSFYGCVSITNCNYLSYHRVTLIYIYIYVCVFLCVRSRACVDAVINNHFKHKPQFIFQQMNLFSKLFFLDCVKIPYCNIHILLINIIGSYRFDTFQSVSLRHYAFISIRFGQFYLKVHRMVHYHHCEICCCILLANVSILDL